MLENKGGMNAKKKHNRVLKMAKGYRGARSKQYRVAKQSVMRALTSSYAGRKQRKRQFRQLWIARINAAARINGLSYSKFMYGLKLAGVEMNRKVLSDMAINDAEGFAKLAELAKAKIKAIGFIKEHKGRTGVCRSFLRCLPSGFFIDSVVIAPAALGLVKCLVCIAVEVIETDALFRAKGKADTEGNGLVIHLCMLYSADLAEHGFYPL